MKNSDNFHDLILLKSFFTIMEWNIQVKVIKLDINLKERLCINESRFILTDSNLTT